MELSDKKEKWANSRSRYLNGYLLGDSITKNRKAEIYYKGALDKEIDKFIASLIKDLKKVYTPLFNAEKVANAKPSPAQIRILLNQYKGAKLNILIRNSDRIIRKWLKMASKSVNKSIKEMLYDLAGGKISINYSKRYDEALKLMIARNVQLITNTATQTLTNIENIVYDSMTTGGAWGSLENSLKTQTHISRDRIKRIARDQTAKTNQALNELEQIEAGVEYFKWTTAHDERVSTGYGGHKQLDGKIYKWGETERYPVIDSYGHKGLPSQRVNCRCDARAIFILEGYKAVWNADKESYEVVKK